jgi:phage shock protein PspC (stress-responsive transcriptional regulator)
MPERLMERQIERGKGSRDDRIREAGRSSRLLIVAAVCNGIAVILGLLGQDGNLRRLWLVLGAFWLVFSYFLYRQRRYLNTLSTAP